MTEWLDIEDFDQLAPEVESLIAAWLDRGVSPKAIWAVLASMVLGIASDNGVTWETLERTLRESWEQGRRLSS